MASGFRDMPEDRGEPWDMFDKEDMSDMFSRAMLEKMQLVGEYIICIVYHIPLTYNIPDVQTSPGPSTPASSATS